MHPIRSTIVAAILASLPAFAACEEPASQSTASPSTASASTASPVVAPDVVAPAVADGGWYSDVSAIVAADAGQGRRAAIRSRLKDLQLTARDVPFTVDRQSGVNLLADVSGDAEAPLLLLGAHSDQVSKGEGATDNASGSATVLALAQRLKARPLAHHRVAIAFWDLEEKGLLGSKAYVAAAGSAKPALYVNFDVFGWGDTVWLMTPQAGSPLEQATADAARVQGLKLSAGDQYPPTDHLSFLKAGWPAVSYSLVGGDEISLILEMYAGRKPASVPKVMQVIHSDDDTLAHIDAVAAQHGVDTIEAALRAWDAANAPATATR